MTARQRLAWVEAEAIADTVINPEVDTIAWATKELSSASSTAKTRRKASKILAQEQLPAVSFDDVEKALSLVYGTTAKAAELRAGVENPVAEKILERSLIVDALSTGYGSLRLRKRGNQAQILATIGILELVDSGEEYSRDSKLVQQIAGRAIIQSAAIWRFFRLDITESKDVIRICHRLLKQLGYVIDKEGKPGAIFKTRRTGQKGNQVQHYQILEHPSTVYEQLLSAARARLSLLAVVSKGEVNPLGNDGKEMKQATPPAFGSSDLEALPFDTSADMGEDEEFDEDGLSIDDPDDFGLEEIDD